jgi:hypothetical protein
MLGTGDPHAGSSKATKKLRSSARGMSASSRNRLQTASKDKPKFPV